MADHGACRHCGAAKGSRPRGLCSRCYFDRAIRPLYPVHEGDPGRSPKNRYREPTAEEVEALIAEQLKPENLPAWWPADYSRRHEGRADDD
jgi:hypothetical protein